MVINILVMQEFSDYLIIPTTKMTCEGVPENMQAKQVHEIASMLEVGAKIENVTLLRATKEGDDSKEGWNLQFDYQSIHGKQSCMLITQLNKIRFWVSLDTAVKDVCSIFPNVKNINLLLEQK